MRILFLASGSISSRVIVTGSGRKKSLFRCFIWGIRGQLNHASHELFSLCSPHWFFTSWDFLVVCARTWKILLALHLHLSLFYRVSWTKSKGSEEASYRLHWSFALSIMLWRVFFDKKKKKTFKTLTKGQPCLWINERSWVKGMKAARWEEHRNFFSLSLAFLLVTSSSRGRCIFSTDRRALAVSKPPTQQILVSALSASFSPLSRSIISRLVPNETFQTRLQLQVWIFWHLTSPSPSTDRIARTHPQKCWSQFMP